MAPISVHYARHCSLRYGNLVSLYYKRLFERDILIMGLRGTLLHVAGGRHTRAHLHVLDAKAARTGCV